jgi:hypothetical protein
MSPPLEEEGQYTHCRGSLCGGGDDCGAPDPPNTHCGCFCLACQWQKGFTAGYRQCRQDNEAAANDARFP